MKLLEPISLPKKVERKMLSATLALMEEIVIHEEKIKGKI